MPSIEIRIPSAQEDHDLLIAKLDDLPVEGFEQREGLLMVYIDGANWTDRVQREIETRSTGLRNGPVSTSRIGDRNWNAEWESSIRPLRVGSFVIQPSWTTEPAARDCLKLVIDPQMSFGTGYHESTRVLLRRMPDYIRDGQLVLDVGTGTGILSIASILLGAAGAVAVDTDPWCVRNVRDNAALNQVSDKIRTLEGSISELQSDARFDVVLANINREVLLGMLPELLELGRIVAISGLLKKDRAIMISALNEAGARIVQEEEEANWWSAWALR